VIPCQTINSLPEDGFVAGNRQTFSFECVDENGVTINIATGSASLKVSPYGNPSYVVLTKLGDIYDTNKFTVTLERNDTINLSGLYIFQPTVTDVFGRPYTPAQGTWFIQPAIN